MHRNKMPLTNLPSLGLATHLCGADLRDLQSARRRDEHLQEQRVLLLCVGPHAANHGMPKRVHMDT